MPKPIVRVIHHYHPEWVPPDDNGREWIRTGCPFHGDDTPSAAVSYGHNAFRCLACPARGNAVTLVMNLEGVSYREAVKRSAEILGGSSSQIPPESTGQRCRGVFEDTGAGTTGDREVPARVCGRTFTGA